MVFQGSFQEVIRVVQESVKGISRKFQRRLKTVSREFSVGFNFAPNPISSLR